METVIGLVCIAGIWSQKNMYLGYGSGKELVVLTLLHSVGTTLTQIDETFDGQMSQSHSFSNYVSKSANSYLDCFTSK